MYYNSNKNHHDYYNAYKKEISELEAYQKEEDREKFIKLILSLLSLILFILATFYLYKYFNPELDVSHTLLKNEKKISKTKPSKSIIIREEGLPKSIQLRQSNIYAVQNIKSNTSDTLPHKKVTSTISEKDIALIVQIIMSQLNAKIEKPLELQLQEIKNKNFVNKSLEKTNHYNKIVLTKNEVQEVKNSSLMKLSTGLTNIMNEEIEKSSNYIQEITKEVYFRENEMRIIIVQRGDTLSRIAKKAYGDDTAYQKIFVANPELIKNPNQIFIGQRLRIPS